MDGFGDAFAGITVAVVAGILGVLGLIVLALAIVFDGKRNPDDTGQRTTAVYLGVVSFVLLWTLILAVTLMVHSVTSLLVDEDARSGASVEVPAIPQDIQDEFQVPDEERDEGPDPQDQVIQDTVQSGLVAVVAGSLLLFHLRRRRTLSGDEAFEGTPAWRADRAYLYLVCAVAVLVIVAAVSAGAYDLFRIAVPGITAEGAQDVERDRAINNLLTLLALVGGSAYAFGKYWKQVSGEPEFWHGWREKLQASRTKPGQPPPPMGPPGSAPPPTGPPVT